MTAPMAKHTPIAGGFFLILPILVGFAWGLFARQTTLGVLVGLGVGLALAGLLWAVERARSRRGPPS